MTKTEGKKPKRQEDSPKSKTRRKMSRNVVMEKMKKRRGRVMTEDKIIIYEY